MSCPLSVSEAEQVHAHGFARGCVGNRKTQERARLILMSIQ